MSVCMGTGAVNSHKAHQQTALFPYKEFHYNEARLYKTHDIHIHPHIDIHKKIKKRVIPIKLELRINVYPQISHIRTP